MDSMFLTGDELGERTGCRTYWAQVRWLRTNRIRHKVREDGSPVVLRSVFNRDVSERPMTDPLAMGIGTMATFQKNVSAVYFLKRGDRVMYVGVSTNLFSRLAQHLSGEKDFDSISFMEVPKKDAFHIERELIARFDPPLNIRKAASSNELQTDFSQEDK